MKKHIYILSIILFPLLAGSQLSYPDSLRAELKHAAADSTKYDLFSSLAWYYEERQLDSAVFYGEQALIIARKHNKQLSIASALLSKAFPLRSNGKYGEALQCILESMTILVDPLSEKNEWRYDSSDNFTTYRLSNLSSAHHVYALLEADMGNIDQELFHYKEEIRISEMINKFFGIQVAYMNLGNTYRRLGKPDSALHYGLKADSMAKTSGRLYTNGWNLGNIGDVYFKKKDIVLAKKYYYEALELSKKVKNEGSLRASNSRLFWLYFSEKNADSSLFYAKQKLKSSISNEFGYLTLAYESLYDAYTLKGQADSATKYLKLAFTTRDSAYKERIKNLKDFQHLSMNEQLRLRELEKERVEYQAKIRTWSLLAGLAVFLFIALLLFRNNRLKKRSNKILENTLSNLRATQTQLIQSEKMASLGELTAGIAHEIQNPLNFVNNFSEVSKELLDEMREALAKGDTADAKDLMDNVIQNLEKINHHGKRADGIVKGMLQHSRSSSGQMEPTDINALADEYLRLAYHGLRAKDKSFNATMKTALEEGLPKVNVIPQDIGRVVLNLITNAFYVVNEKKNSGLHGYEPTVTVSTRKVGDKVELCVKDNGSGIPSKVLEKIFQPFFTTKPTGQGTGLGLSLSYDIVKAHGGELKVETREGEGSRFIIQLPSS